MFIKIDVFDFKAGRKRHDIMIVSIKKLIHMKSYMVFITLSLVLLFSRCTPNNQKDKGTTVAKKDSTQKAAPVEERKIIERKKPSQDISYRAVNSKKWISKHDDDSSLLHYIATINRTDINYLKEKTSILIPSDSSADIAYFMPFPLSVASIKNINKIIFFSYPTQTFGAYENGELVYTGATNMGREKNQTPTGLYFTNWKAEETTSTFNDEWNLRWNFNIDSKMGIGWHQYEMPGYPASHSCMRLMKTDAKYLYSWADQWIMKNDTVKAQGTPVVVFGSYNFKAPQPWKKLTKDPHVLDIAETDIEHEVTPFLPKIEAEQKRRAKAVANN